MGCLILLTFVFTNKGVLAAFVISSFDVIIRVERIRHNNRGEAVVMVVADHFYTVLLFVVWRVSTHRIVGDHKVIEIFSNLFPRVCVNF